MRKLLFASALVVAATLQPVSLAAAKGRPTPTPTPVDCQLDISGRMQCAYETQNECLTALRALRRTNRTASGCFYSTADPEWWHYHLWILEYYP